MTVEAEPATREDDVVDVEIHQRTLIDIAREMAITLLRTSGSPVVTEGKDFSTCVLDAAGEQLAQSGYVSFHVSTAVLGVRAVLDAIPLEAVRPGDAYICNDPHTSGAIHQGDVGVVAPYFHDGELVGWGYVNEHVLDIGGAAISGFAVGARDCFSEALRFPAVRFVTDGALDPQWERFIATNVRMPGTVVNDIRSMIAALNAGQRRLASLLDEVGHERFAQRNARTKALSEEAVRARVAQLPDGTYESEDWVEYDVGGPQQLFEVRCRLLVEGDEMTIQLRGDPQVDDFVNGARPAMLGQAWTTLLALLVFDVPVNAGIWRPIRFDLGPAGTIVNASPPAPVSMGHMETGMRVNKLLVDVLSQACALSDDELVRSRVAGQPAQDNAFFTASGVDDSGAPLLAFPASLSVGSGGGAQSVIDGLECYGAQCTVGLSIADVEIEEASQPGLILWRRIAPDTGGPGRHRGGAGLDSAFAMLGARRLDGNAYASCMEVPPRGAAGGHPGAPGSWRVVRDSNVLELLRQGVLPAAERLEGRVDPTQAKTASLVLRRGDVFVSVHGGGGGLGDPLARDPSAVAADVAGGFVSRAQAQDVYGVALGTDGAVDADATAAARARLREGRLGAPPARDARSDAEGVAVVDGRWCCAACRHDLGPSSGNWRGQTRSAETEAPVRLAAIHSWARPRGELPPVVVRDHICPSCATSLGVDVTVEGHPIVPSARLGACEPWAGSHGVTEE